MVNVAERADELFASEACGSSEHVRLASKVRINGSMCHPGTTCDHVHRRIGKAVACELVQGGVEDPLVRYDFLMVLGHGSAQLARRVACLAVLPVRPVDASAARATPSLAVGGLR